MASVFQSLKAQLPPLVPAPPPPDPSIPEDLGAEDQQLQQALPKLSRPSPFVRMPTSQEKISEHLGNRLDQDYQKDLHPWGTEGSEHPGVFGKIAHVLSHITGGDTRREWEEQGLEKRIGDLASENAKNEYEGAETGRTREETAEMPGKTQTAEDYQKAETDRLLHPSEKWEPVAGWQGPQNEPMEYNPATGVYRPAPGGAGASLTRPDASPKSLEHVSVIGPDGKPMMANYHPDTGKITDASGKEIPNARPYEKSPEGPHQLMMVPDGKGGFTATNVLPGMHIGAGTLTAPGVNTVNTPTSAIRTAAGRAQMVNDAIPGVLADIEKNKDQMGPLMGRWNDFMQGKLGNDNPDFAALRMDLTLMGTAVALAHAQGRLPENLREEFDRAINAPQQTPENLSAAIRAVQPWMARMQEAGQVGGQQPHSAEPQRPANVPKEYIFKDGPKGKGWYRP